MSDKTIMACPACREAGKDTAGDNLSVFPSGRFHCIAAGKDKAHNARIIALTPELGGTLAVPEKHRQTARPLPKPNGLDLLARIKRNYPAHAVDLWESSPVLCDEDLDDAKAFLRLFPADAVLWIANDVRMTGRPEHTLFFRTRVEWEAEKITAPGMRVAPSAFRQGAISRKAANVTRHLFAVVESDTLAKDDFCTVLRWLREACGWKLAAVVDSGNKSLHAWFRHPGTDDMEQLSEHAASLGLDTKFSEPSQPWRLPGVARENATTRQCLLYLDSEAAL